MGDKSAISWTHATFNPWEGCVKVSEECSNCYAAARDERFHNGENWGKDAGRFHHAPAYWRQPYAWDRAALAAGERRRVFCGSLCDIMEDRPDLTAARNETFRISAETKYLDWLFLTKWPQNFSKFLPDYPPHWWLGTTVGVKKSLWRIDAIRDLPARVKFLSIEPLLEDLGKIDLRGISWVICGAESGQGARPMNRDWARSVRDQAVEQGARFFYKQEAVMGVKVVSPMLDGRQWLEFPEAA